VTIDLVLVFVAAFVGTYAAVLSSVAWLRWRAGRMVQAWDREDEEDTLDREDEEDTFCGHVYPLSRAHYCERKRGHEGDHRDAYYHWPLGQTEQGGS